MATLTELNQLIENNQLQGKLRAAMLIKAHTVLNTAGQPLSRINWATEIMRNPETGVKTVLHYLLAANAGATQASIVNADDTVIQSNVNTSIDKIFVT